MLAILDEVARTGRRVVVTKRGKPVAKLVPVKPVRKRELADSIFLVTALRALRLTFPRW